MNDWLIIITAILIIAILADGVRRMHLSRRDKIRVSRKMYKQPLSRDDVPPSPPEAFTSELPNGGARVVNTRDSITSSRQPASVRGREVRKPQQTSLGLDDNVPPTLMEPVEDVLMKGHEDESAYELPAQPRSEQTRSRHENNEPQERIEPGFFSEAEEAIIDDDRYADEGEASRAVVADSYAYPDDEGDELDDDYDYEPEEDDEGYDEDYDDQDDDEDDYLDDEPELPEDPADPLTRAAPAKAQAEPEEVLIVNIMASRGSVFNGGELLDALLKAGLRFGDMNIFHRYSDIKGEGELLFSMANMVKPGTFDLDAMDEFETPGVSLFMTLPLKADSMQSFDLMIESARAIAEALDGELKDEQRSVMTRQTIDHSRERIRDFERRRLFSRQRRD